MTKRQTTLIIFTMVAAFSLAGMMQAEDAAADDLKYMPGTMCFANNGKQEQYLRHYPAGTRNKRTRSVKVTCPLIRDNYLSNSFEAAGVWIGQAGTSTTRCWLRSSNYDGSITQIASKSLSGSGFIIWNPLPINSYNTGFMTIQCRLPYNAWVIKYAQREDAGTDTH